MNLKPKGLINSVFTILIVASLGLMVLVVFTNAVLRYAFNSGIPAGEELSRYFMIWISALGTVIAYKENKHVGVDIVVSALKGLPLTIVQSIGRLLTIVTFSLVAWGGVEYFKTSAASPGPATGIPFGYISISIIVISVSIVVLSAIDLVRDIRVGRREVK